MTRLTFGMLAAMLALAGCDAGSPNATPETPWTTREVRVTELDTSEVFTLVTSIHFADSDSSVIAFPAALHTTSAGAFVLADLSEANVKEFGSDGQLRRQVGRKGQGPGEFVLPTWVRSDDRGRVHALDAARDLMIIFDENGRVVRQFKVPAGGADQFELTSDGQYVLFGGDIAVDSNVVTVVDTLGAHVAGHLPIAFVRPLHNVTLDEWWSMRSFKGTVLRDTAFVMVSYSDTIWAVDLRTGSLTSTRLEIPSYRPPNQPPSGLRNDRIRYREWQASFHSVFAVTAAGDHLVVALSAANAEPRDMINLLRLSDGSWVSSRARRLAYGLGTENVVQLEFTGAGAVAHVYKVREGS